VSDQIIRVTARPRADGIDVDRLALVLLEIVKRLPESQRDRLAAGGAKLIADAEARAKISKREGAA
jgi:hypothetical protein